MPADTCSQGFIIKTSPFKLIGKQTTKEKQIRQAVMKNTKGLIFENRF
jgi:hypothetical protein